MISAQAYPWLFVAGLCAGFVDAIAGGGGLITLPVLLNAGLPPQDALGTNKLQACFGSGGATLHFGRAGLIDFGASLAGVGYTFLGALAGTLVVQRLNPGFLRVAIPWLLLAIVLYLLLRPTLGDQDAHPRMPSVAFYTLFGLGLGFYDGFFGPGTGTFWAMALVMVLGFNLTKATAHTKLLNFASNAASLLVFLSFGQVQATAGLLMGVGQILGAQLGAHMVILRGARFIRPIFITVVLALTARLLWLNFSWP
jgi:uncharacterized membrane protein YfcA